MEWYGHIINPGYQSNIFLPASNRECYFCNKSNYFFCYDQIIGSYIRIRKNLPIWKLKDNYFNCEWTLSNVGYLGYPVFQTTYSGKKWYIYYHNASLFDIGTTGLYVYPDLGYPCGEKTRLVYDYDYGSASSEYVWEDCFYTNSTSFSEGMTFKGKGSYDGQTMTINFQLTTTEIWYKTSSKSTAYGEYVPYSGTYGDSSVSDNHYLGCKYWTSGSSVPDMSKDSR